MGYQLLTGYRPNPNCWLNPPSVPSSAMRLDDDPGMVVMSDLLLKVNNVWGGAPGIGRRMASGGQLDLFPRRPCQMVLA
jgi:hypothetical protein